MRKKVFIIAEAGVNHNGKLHLAKQLVNKAKLTGCDAIKFQIFQADEITSSKANIADYQKRNTKGKFHNQKDMLKELELSLDQFKELKNYCREKDILFLATPFDDASLAWLVKQNAPIIKVASGEITNHPFLEKIARSHKGIILSTGMSNLNEVKEAVQTIFKAGNKKLSLLHCVTEYPAPYDQMNLRAMATLEKTFKLPVGLSDHTLGFHMSLAAVALGATIIEKHITLDKNLPGPDHRASLDPTEFKMMVNAIRDIEGALGSGIKKPSACEVKYRDVVRKSIVLTSGVTRGEKVTEKVIGIKRPAGGIEPKYFNRIVGKNFKKNMRAGDILQWGHLS